MPITPLFTAQDIEKAIKEELDKKEKVIINTLNYVGKTAVNVARSGHKYIDQTGNLTSSIGYMIVKDGAVLNESSFPTVKGGSKGKSEGKAFLSSLLLEYPRGIYLIVVAGMKYAAYVEAIGLDVLTSAELLADRLVPEMLTKLGFKLK
jgi:hypothetical protein